MKTAKEWEMLIRFESALQVQIIKQIQLDAMREGMRRAAEEIDVRCLHLERRPWTLDVQNLHTAILSAAEKLTEKDLG